MLKGKECSGGKYGKERITIIIGSNMSGTEKKNYLSLVKQRSLGVLKELNLYQLVK